VPLLDPQQELVGTKIVAVPISSTSFSSSSLLLAQSFFTSYLSQLEIVGSHKSSKQTTHLQKNLSRRNTIIS
jgi:hypothetical protein